MGKRCCRKAGAGDGVFEVVGRRVGDGSTLVRIDCDWDGMTMCCVEGGNNRSQVRKNSMGTISLLQLSSLD